MPAVTETGWLEWAWRAFITAAIGALIGVVGQYLVPRLRKLKERADTAQVMANTAKTEAEKAKTTAEANTAEFGFYKAQLDYLQDRVSDLETAQNLLKSQQYRFRAHIDDLYNAIGQEPVEVQTRLKSRLKTQRPNGDKPHKEEG
jgi:chromosome segregation ATPase